METRYLESVIADNRFSAGLYVPVRRIYSAYAAITTETFASTGGGAEVFTGSLLLDLYLWPPSTWLSKLEKNLGKIAVH